MTKQMTLVTPVCACCAQPQPLLPRTDLDIDAAVCPSTGLIYRAEGTGYVPVTFPGVRRPYTPLPDVQVDLMQAGYA